MDDANANLPPVDAIDARLAALLPPEGLVPRPLTDAMRYSCLAPGKRLRPRMVLAAAAAVGGDPARALDPACAVEMVHAFSLIHDDLPALDDDDLRRGRPTCHKVYGEAMAILAGDALFALAFQTIGEADAPAEVRAAASLELARACAADGGLVGGEALDLLSEGTDPDLARLRQIHAGKTGALFAAACAIGGRFGGGGPASVEALRAYGREVGLAFQIADDILNEVGDAAQLGKAVGSDRERGKATYPGLMGLDAARGEATAASARAVAALEALPGPSGPLAALAHAAVHRAQ